MVLFADRYFYLPSKTRLEDKQNLLWPVYAWKVLFPSVTQRQSTNLFQEAILGLIRANVSDVIQIANMLTLDPELIRYIIATQLLPNKWLDSKMKLTTSGMNMLDGLEANRAELNIGYAFQDAISGEWLPRFTNELTEITPYELDSKGRPRFLLDREKGRYEQPYILRHDQPASHDLARVSDAYQAYCSDYSSAKRLDHSINARLDMPVIEVLSSESTPMYLWCELYRDEGEPQPWLVSDPFRIRKAASWLRKPLLELAPKNPSLIHKMQELTRDINTELSAEEWLRKGDEQAQLSLWSEYAYTFNHPLISDHLERVLRQQRKIKNYEKFKPKPEETSALIGEAHNLVEAVLKWMLKRWPTDTSTWPKKTNWSRAEAKEIFVSLNLPSTSKVLTDKLAGQQLKSIINAIKDQNQPLKALLAATVLCAGEHTDHPFRTLNPGALNLERLPKLADLRNVASGHASGKIIALDEVLNETQFAIQWMALFQPWY